MSRKKRPHANLDTKRKFKINVVSKSKSGNCVKTFAMQTDAFAVPSQASQHHSNAFNSEITKKHYSVEYVKKKKRQNRQSQSLDSDAGDCDVTSKYCLLAAEIKPDVSLKRKRNAEKTSCSDVTHDVLETQEPKKGRKKKQHSAEVDQHVKLKRTRTVSIVADKSSLGRAKSNFDIVHLRSVLQQHGWSPSQQDKSCTKSRTLQKGQEISTGAEEDRKTTESSSSSSLCEKTSSGRSSSVLKERMLNRLAGARFRFINEELYRLTGSEAADMFARNEDAFMVYHAGFQSQVSKWPTNPVDKMIDYISTW